MPAFRNPYKYSVATVCWHGDAILVYGWDEDMTQEWRCLAYGPITKSMTEDESAIPALVVKGDRTYVFKDHVYVQDQSHEFLAGVAALGGCSFDDLLDWADNPEEEIFLGEVIDFDDVFWQHVERFTGKTYDDAHRDVKADRHRCAC